LRTDVLFQFRYHWLLAVLLLLVVGVSPAFSAGNEGAVSSARATWEEKCVACHGASGKGDGWRTKPMFWMKTPNFTDAAYMQKRSDDALLQVLKAGGPTGMPAYGLKMSDPELKELVAFVKGFYSAPEPAKPAAKAPAAPTKSAGKASAEPTKPAGAARK